MRKGIVLLCFLFYIGGLAGCLSSVKTGNQKNDETKVDKKSDIIVKIGGESNLDKFQQFLTHVKNGKADKVRIVYYTDEGDPIFQTLDYDGININYLFDDSNDKFGGSQKGKKSDVCKGIMKEKSDEAVSYKLSECKGNRKNVSYFLLEVRHE
ncbi:DUF4362 domain-containing protein [Bacillus sp. BP-3]|uniref:DUF4362 domain-containing protein n=1 Tax=Bacillus sp. BP-3 TaxID=3022773 RepID=UPI00232F4EA2|nr:DUF4362 domain-containing protein [Bacillus sp. BP-3]MDC2865485.1 DUF4362 domain-containing protein [Bacillus sp. BP-3]